MLDSGASHNFISTAVVQSCGFKPSPGGNGLSVRLANGSQLASQLLQKDIMVEIDSYRDGSQRFYSIDLQGADVVLGMPWLRSVNPSIDWVTGSMKFVHDARDHTLNPMVSDMHEKDTIAMLCSARAVARSIRKGAEVFLCLVRPADTTSSESAQPPGVLNSISNSKISRLNSKIQRLVQQYLHNVFPDELPGGQSPQTPITHAIDLEAGKTVRSRPPCKMSQKELQELRKQLDELLAKGFIKPSTSPFGAPVLFVKKKDGTRRMCM